MKPSSSASQSERADEQRGDVSLDDVGMCNEGGFRFFDFRIALRKYFMGTPAVASFCFFTNGCQPFQIQVSRGFLCNNRRPKQNIPKFIVLSAFEGPAIGTGKWSERNLAVCCATSSVHPASEGVKR
jgi:hypothetical protein